MPTPLDRALHSKSAFIGFAGIIGAVAAWSIWGGDMFPKEADPVGDPREWTASEMSRWLKNRDVFTTGKETREELLARIESAVRQPKP